jgi:uncharacterized protein
MERDALVRWPVFAEPPPRVEYALAPLGRVRFAATSCCLGIRAVRDGRWRLYAPHGLADVFNLVVRPNPVLAPRAVCEAKTARWREQWPPLAVLPWPDDRPADS